MQNGGCPGRECAHHFALTRRLGAQNSHSRRVSRKHARNSPESRTVVSRAGAPNHPLYHLHRYLRTVSCRLSGAYIHIQTMSASLSHSGHLNLNRLCRTGAILWTFSTQALQVTL